MTLSRLHISGYRSIKDVWLKLNQVNVIVGANGTGKSNLYRAMYLLASAATGQFARLLAEEGGLDSALWAGDRSKGTAVRMTFEVSMSNMDYKLSIGLPEQPRGNEQPPPPFPLDPRIKEEIITLDDGKRRIPLFQRNQNTITARDSDGNNVFYPMGLDHNESILSGLVEPHRFPEISLLRQQLLRWRFYHAFRTDSHSPIRRSQTGIFTPLLANDGSDLAAALYTIIEFGDAELLYDTLESAFPGSTLEIVRDRGQFSVCMRMPEFHRSFDVRELSDGTLQFLCLMAALLSFRPPSLIVLNEPESSIHQDLLEPLAKLIARASKNSQLWITTHSTILADLLTEYTGANAFELAKVDGATEIVGANRWGESN